MKNLIKNELYNIDITFENYSMETDNGVIKGYYAKVPTIKPVTQKTIDTSPENWLHFNNTTHWIEMDILTGGVIITPMNK